MNFLLNLFRSETHPDKKYVYVNQDGSVRELSNNEQEYLNEWFHPGDGARPYIKRSYRTKDGWGSISGYLPRKKVPSSIGIAPVNPEYDSLVSQMGDEDPVEVHRLVGDIVKANPDGSITCTPNPNMSSKDRFEAMRKIELERQKAREELARQTNT